MCQERRLMVNGSEAVAEILKREGVEEVYCFPFTPILDS